MFKFGIQKEEYIYCDITKDYYKKELRKDGITLRHYYHLGTVYDNGCPKGYPSQRKEDGCTQATKCKFCPVILGTVKENTRKTDVSDKARAFGQFFTPSYLAEELAEKLNIPDGSTDDIMDPCVGHGALLEAVKKVYPFVKNEQLYGIDIDVRNVEVCIEKFPGGHFQLGNCLTDDFTDEKFWKKNPLEWANPNLL